MAVARKLKDSDGNTICPYTSASQVWAYITDGGGETDLETLLQHFYTCWKAGDYTINQGALKNTGSWMPSTAGSYVTMLSSYSVDLTTSALTMVAGPYTYYTSTSKQGTSFKGVRAVSKMYAGNYYVFYYDGTNIIILNAIPTDA